MATAAAAVAVCDSRVFPEEVCFPQKKKKKKKKKPVAQPRCLGWGWGDPNEERSG